MAGIVILAAGWGSRYGGLKQIDDFGPTGESLLEYAVYDAWRCGLDELFMVIREDMVKLVVEKFKTAPFNLLKCQYIIQKTSDVPISLNSKRAKPWGTAHALYSCRKQVKKPFILINADDFYGLESFQTLSNFLATVDTDQPLYSLVGFRLKNSLSIHGGVSRGICEVINGQLLNITEKFGLKQVDPKTIVDSANQVYSGHEFISMNCWGFTPEIFKHLTLEFKNFLNSSNDLIQQEFMLPTVIMNLITKKLCQVNVFSSENKPFGITYQSDKPIVQKLLSDLHLNNKYPDSLKTNLEALNEKKEPIARSLWRHRML